jgi:hypothetical protein
MRLFVYQDQSTEVLWIAPEHAVRSGPLQLLLQRPGTEIVSIDCEVESYWLASLIDCRHLRFRQGHSDFKFIAVAGSSECELAVIERFGEHCGDVVLAIASPFDGPIPPRVISVRIEVLFLTRWLCGSLRSPDQEKQAGGCEKGHQAGNCEGRSVGKSIDKRAYGESESCTH